MECLWEIHICITAWCIEIWYWNLAGCLILPSTWSTHKVSAYGDTRGLLAPTLNFGIPLFISCTPVVPHLLCTSSALSHKSQSLAQYCSCCTWLTLRTLLTDTVSLFTRLPTTCSCTCIAAMKTSPRQPLGSRSASLMLVPGCPLTGSNWTQTRLSYSGLGQDIAYLNSIVMVHLYNWAPILSQLATMCGCLE